MDCSYSVPSPGTNLPGWTLPGASDLMTQPPGWPGYINLMIHNSHRGLTCCHLTPPPNKHQKTNSWTDDGRCSLCQNKVKAGPLKDTAKCNDKRLSREWPSRPSGYYSIYQLQETLTDPHGFPRWCQGGQSDGAHEGRPHPDTSPVICW